MSTTSILVFLQLISFLFLFNIGAGKARLLKMETSIKPKVVNKMLIPRNSTTALKCEPIFTGPNSQARWYRNGVIVANVSSTSNAVLHNRTYHTEQAIPDVGFLIIANISLEDEGDYWCRRIDNKQEGEVARIVVAYVEQFPNNSRPTFRPASVHFGQNVTAHCPKTKAVPPAIYTWFLNGKAIDLSTERIIQNSNGSLRIQQFLRQDIGVYECVARNFAGRTSAKTYMNAITHVSNDIFDGGVFRAACQNLSQGGLMWFLIGCLITCSVMLSYLLCSVFISRSNYWNRTSLYSSLFFQVQPNLVPRFRKVVAPIDDMHRNLRFNVPEQYNI